MSSCLLKNVFYTIFKKIIYLTYMHKKDLALNNLLWLICHQTKSYIFNIYVERGFGIK